MIFKTLGIMDLVAVVIFLGAAIFPKEMLLYAGIYLAAKGLFFVLLSKDIASYGDAASGIYIILFAIGLRIPILNTAFIIYLVQKTILTMIKVSIETYSIYRFIRESAKPRKTPTTDYSYIR